MTINLFDRKIVKFLGLIILIIGISITTIIIKNPQIFDTKASPDENPINIRITNISDSQFSVSYTTNNKTIGTILLGTDPNNLEIIVLDDRDQLNQTVNSYKAHHISPKDLDPNTKYYFLITSGDKKFINDKSLFSVTTGPIINTNPPLQQPLSGDVKLPNGNDAEEGIVYLNTDGSQEISTLISNGKYLLPLNNLLTENLTNYFQLNNNTQLNINATSNGLMSQMKLNYNSANPVKTIYFNNPPQGGVEAPTPTLNEGSQINPVDSPTVITNTPTPSTNNISEKSINGEKIKTSENQQKKTNSSKNLSGIIFGLGALLIVGSGIILFFFTHEKK